MAVLQIKVQPPVDVRDWVATDKSCGLGCAAGDWFELGGDAGAERYVTFETLQKLFSQVSESQESGPEIRRRKKLDKQIYSQ